MPYRSRGYFPHLELPDSTYFVTFRLAGTLPQTVLQEIKDELSSLKRIEGKTPRQLMDLKYLETKKIQDYLDKGIGECWLNNPSVARMVRDSMLYFDKERYISHAFCLMPNHVHWLLTPQYGTGSQALALPFIMWSIKSFSYKEANKILKRVGHFWSKEYYDHLVRSSEEFGRLLVYILENPIKANLCTSWHDWQWTWCSETIQKALKQEPAGGGRYK